MELPAHIPENYCPGVGDLGIREKRKAPGQQKRPGRSKRYATGNVAWVMHSEVRVIPTSSMIVTVMARIAI